MLSVRPRRDSFLDALLGEIYDRYEWNSAACISLETLDQYALENSSYQER
jgi:hypothetical protein